VITHVFTNPEALLIVAAMAVLPDDARMTRIDTLVGALKAAGVWTKMDVLWVMAAHDAQAGLINWKNPAALTLGLSPTPPTFTANQGYQPNGVNSYLITGYNAGVFGGQYTLNLAHMGVWSLTDSGSGIDIGARTGATTAQSNMFIRNATNDFGLRMNVNTDVVLAGISTNSIGHFIGNRSSSTARQGYRNGVSFTSTSITSASIAPYPWFLGAVNQAGAAAGYSNRLQSIAHAGGSLDATEALATYDALNAYMTGL